MSMYVHTYMEIGVYGKCIRKMYMENVLHMEIFYNGLKVRKSNNCFMS